MTEEDSGTVPRLLLLPKMLENFASSAAFTDEPNWRLHGRVRQIHYCWKHYSLHVFLIIPIFTEEGGSNISGHLILERLATRSWTGGLLKVPAADQGAVDEDVDITASVGKHTVVAKLTLARDLTPTNVLAVAAAIHRLEPMYSMLSRNCFWFAWTVMEMLRRLADTPPDVQRTTKKDETLLPQDLLGPFPRLFFTDFKTDGSRVEKFLPLWGRAIQFKLEIAVEERKKKDEQRRKLSQMTTAFGLAQRQLAAISSKEKDRTDAITKAEQEEADAALVMERLL
ncbi:hypothetical protein B0H13DRAFT_2384062 [Mycena leptocephala]|nr:hypothetical protein B0H13DRAFT_2384062 [Mycena leptocephala]